MNELFHPSPLDPSSVDVVLSAAETQNNMNNEDNINTRLKHDRFVVRQ